MKGPVDFEKSMFTECFHSDELILYRGTPLQVCCATSLFQLPFLLVSIYFVSTKRSVIFISERAVNLVVSRYEIFSNY